MKFIQTRRAAEIFRCSWSTVLTHSAPRPHTKAMRQSISAKQVAAGFGISPYLLSKLASGKDQLLTLTEAAALLGISAANLGIKVREGEIKPKVHLVRIHRFLRSEIEREAAKRRKAAA